MPYTPYQTSTLTKTFFHKVFGLMAGALAITAATALGIAMNPFLFKYIFSNSLVTILLIIGQLAAVVSLSAFIMRMSTPMALLIYALYSVSVGVTTSAVLFVYTPDSVYTTFLVCALMFGVMALYGYFSDADLSSMGSLARMGVIGLIIALMVNLYFKNETLDLILSFLGVGIFLILTAYDMQRIKGLGVAAGYDSHNENRFALMGALTLYLDFINLFFMLLRIMGRRRD